MKSVKAVSRSPNVMRISWRDNPKVSSSMPVVYHVYSQHNQLLKYCGNTTGKSIDCTRLKPYTKYLFYVRRNEEGINATVSNFTMEDSKWALLQGLTADQVLTLFQKVELIRWLPEMFPKIFELSYILVVCVVIYLVVSALDFQPEGRWSEAWSLPFCRFLNPLIPNMKIEILFSCSYRCIHFL